MVNLVSVWQHHTKLPLSSSSYRNSKKRFKMSSLVGNSSLLKCCKRFYSKLGMKTHLAQSHSISCPYCMVLFHSNTMDAIFNHVQLCYADFSNSPNKLQSLPLQFTQNINNNAPLYEEGKNLNLIKANSTNLGNNKTHRLTDLKSFLANENSHAFSLQSSFPVNVVVNGHRKMRWWVHDPQMPTGWIKQIIQGQKTENFKINYYHPSENLTISSKNSMNQYIRSLSETNLKLKDFEFSRNPKISTQSKILSSERNCQIIRSKASLNQNNFFQQIFLTPLLINSRKSKNFHSNKSSPFKWSPNISKNKPNKPDQYSQDKTDFTTEEEDNSLASINSEIEKLQNVNEKSGAQSCPACLEIFENSFIMNNHYYALHQNFH